MPWSQVGTIMAPAVLASRVVLHQVDTLTLVVGAVGWFLSYELPVRILFSGLTTNRGAMTVRMAHATRCHLMDPS